MLLLNNHQRKTISTFLCMHGFSSFCASHPHIERRYAKGKQICKGIDLLKKHLESFVKGTGHLQLPLRSWTLKAISISAKPSVYRIKANMSESPHGRKQSPSKNYILQLQKVTLNDKCFFLLCQTLPKTSLHCYYCNLTLSKGISPL